jgi:hypothetical protein
MLPLLAMLDKLDMLPDLDIGVMDCVPMQLFRVSVRGSFSVIASLFSDGVRFTGKIIDLSSEPDENTKQIKTQNFFCNFKGVPMVRATYKGRAGLPIGQGLIAVEFFDLTNG